MNCLKRIVKRHNIIAGLIVLLLPSYVMAWSKNIHDNHTHAIIQRLDSKAREFYEILFQQQLSIDVETIGSWADRVRSRSIQGIFAFYNADVPSALQKVKKLNTSNWHYQNQFFSYEKNNCKYAKSGDLVNALIRVDTALKNNPSDTQRAILLAFQIHLIQDIHQPLHAISYRHTNCSHDRGGNASCVEYDNKRCTLNLHQIWDRGFGVFNNAPSNVSSALKPEAFSFAPANWLAESMHYADAIYRYKKRGFTESYIVEAKNITQNQKVLMTYRLVHYLNNYYNEYVKNE